ncbi:MAG: hypothetical protein WAV45_02140 [Propionibacteriaceae bacterium]|nr:hypothetical protein [Propionibacteriaceae bacterium]HBY24112.1 hypothetical protein [Propionibacteriaceae bacterium]
MVTACTPAGTTPPSATASPSPSQVVTWVPPTVGVPRDVTQSELLLVKAKTGTFRGSPAPFAVDLSGERTFIAGAYVDNVGPGFFTPRPSYGMVVTDGRKLAVVSCQWDGSEALGVDTGPAGRAAVQSAIARYGSGMCPNLWIQPTPRASA